MQKEYITDCQDLAKKMFWVQWSVKKVLLTVFWNMKGPVTIDFLEKGTTINSVSLKFCLPQNSPNLLNDHCIYIYIYIYNVRWKGLKSNDKAVMKATIVGDINSKIKPGEGIS